MPFELAKRMKNFGPSIFGELKAYKLKKIAAGCNMIDLSIGSPDIPPSRKVMDELIKYANDENQYGYSMTGIDPFLQAVSEFYRKTKGITLNPKSEILQLMGSQDGLVHLPMVFANPGDIVLVPDPGYTAYATGVAMAGAECYFMPLKEENQFVPDLTKIPEHIAEKAKLMILNFPGNPVPTIASKEFFEDVIQFAKKHHIIILHDAAYSELYFDNQKPISFLSLPGAKEVGLEINSLSKSFSLAGARIAYLAGNSEMIQAVLQFKSNVDYGVFLPVQQAGIVALQLAESITEKARKIYQKRRDLFIEGLHSIGWKVDSPDAGMFVWAKIPDGWNSTDFAYACMDKANVVVVPGVAFGPSGEGYVRIALVQKEEIMKQAVENLKSSGLFTPAVV
ncbi:aspartate/methionine/tyrosine aminotransferase [Oikeobacillus pervagus]|uniref:Aminotransferase n=1 Tax=Oikeobacillus pervagus TaxID=1325931 RepID=A0AAJ1SZG8_9BACI|nr:LL-diaminopimelate aminotransferase [Oikeobacillus pervagus]MDQ0215504.1 aspartate/methionine/tyrosine aminotransferase [Oikeobacillus pervagus]